MVVAEAGVKAEGGIIAGVLGVAGGVVVTRVEFGGVVVSGGATVTRGLGV